MGGSWDGGKGGAAGDGGKGGSGGVGGGGVVVGRGGGGDFIEGSGGGSSFSAVSVSFGDRRSSTTATGFKSFAPVCLESLTETGCFLSEFSSALAFAVSAAVLVSAFVCSKFTDSVSEDDLSNLTLLRAFLGSAAGSLSSARLFSFLARNTGEPFASFPSTLAAAAAAAARSFFFLLSSAPRLEFSGSLVGEILEWRLRDPDLCFLL